MSKAYPYGHSSTSGDPLERDAPDPAMSKDYETNARVHLRSTNTTDDLRKGEFPAVEAWKAWRPWAQRIEPLTVTRADAAVEELEAENKRLEWMLDEACKDPHPPGDPEWAQYKSDLAARYEAERRQP